MNYHFNDESRIYDWLLNRDFWEGGYTCLKIKGIETGTGINPKEAASEAEGEKEKFVLFV